jgi:hypothetical protein
MKNIIKIHLVFLFSIFITNIASASDPTKCGLGPMVVGDGALGYTSNSSTSWATFTAATTSGTLDCNGVLAANDEVRMKYIVESYDQLKIEASKGEGEHLYAFSKLMGCRDSSQNDFASLTQVKYESLFGNDLVNEKSTLENLKSYLSEHDKLSEQCHLGS